MRLLARAAEAVGIVWLALTLAFFGLQLLPGDAVLSTLAATGASPGVIEERQRMLGLDQPALLQYIRYMIGVLSGDLGVSLQDGRPVLEIIGQGASPTVLLAAAASLITLLVGLPLGFVGGAGRRGTRISRAVSGLLMSVPVLWSGTLLLMVVGFTLVDATSLLGLGLPALTLGLSGAGALAAVVDSELRATLGQAFVTTAHAKGLLERTVMRRHVLRAAAGPVITAFVLQLGFLLGGVVFTEVLFNRPGLGRTLAQAALRQDYPLVLGLVAWSAVWYAALLLVADLLTRLLDPRLGAAE